MAARQPPGARQGQEQQPRWQQQARTLGAVAGVATAALGSAYVAWRMWPRAHDAPGMEDGLELLPGNDPISLVPSGARMQGVSASGDKCLCEIPPVSARVLHEQDERFLKELDQYSLFAIKSGKVQGNEKFMHEWDEAMKQKDALDVAQEDLIDHYSSLARKRRALEEALHGAAYVQFNQCRPMKRSLGLHLQCQENWREALQEYRSHEQTPGCVVGAALPLKPASVAGPSWRQLSIFLAALPTRSKEQPLNVHSHGASFL
mmetsp:Transcript_64967/g.120950  ORF Transcript_64967/g.120950 Transcript_64967/m.120950 type:complete len:261 (+) Transcript_64967:73-855(+)